MLRLAAVWWRNWRIANFGLVCGVDFLFQKSHFPVRLNGRFVGKRAGFFIAALVVGGEYWNLSRVDLLCAVDGLRCSCIA